MACLPNASGRFPIVAKHIYPDRGGEVRRNGCLADLLDQPIWSKVFDLGDFVQGMPIFSFKRNAGFATVNCYGTFHITFDHDTALKTVSDLPILDTAAARAARPAVSSRSDRGHMPK